MNVLSRGYAIVKDSNGHVVTGSEKLVCDDELDITLKSGRIRATYKGEMK